MVNPISNAERAEVLTQACNCRIRIVCIYDGTVIIKLCSESFSLMHSADIIYYS